MKEYQKALKENLWKLCLLRGSAGALIVIPVIVLFFQENGLTLQQIFLLQSFYGIVLVALEIPSGYLSDRWGRRNTTILGAFVQFFAILVFALSSTFLGFLASWTMLAIGMSFYSGTLEAITYDTLLELKQEKSYMRQDGRQRFYFFITEAIASVLAGFIALVSLRATLWATLIPYGFGCIIALTLEEPNRHKLQSTDHLDVIIRVCKDTLLHRAALRSIIVLSGIISSMCLALYWFTQPYQVEAGLPLALFGVTHAAVVTIGALASRTTHRIEKRIDDRTFLIAIAVTVVLSYLALSQVMALWGILFLFIGRSAWGFLSPLRNSLINRMAASEVRATVLSVNSFVNKLMFALAAPFLGALGDLYTLNQAFLMTGIIGGVLLIITFILMGGVWKQLPS